MPLQSQAEHIRKQVRDHRRGHVPLPGPRTLVAVQLANQLIDLASRDSAIAVLDIRSLMRIFVISVALILLNPMSSSRRSQEILCSRRTPIISFLADGNQEWLQTCPSHDLHWRCSHEVQWNCAHGICQVVRMIVELQPHGLVGRVIFLQQVILEGVHHVRCHGQFCC